MKKFKVLTALFLVLIVGFLAIKCQHADEDVIPIVGPGPIEHGETIMTCTNCNTDTNVSGSWYHDKAHSNVMWETQYKLFGSKLTGRFDSFFMDNLNFDEANPSLITFEGHVLLNTCNTGEPGRDGNCLLGYLGTDADNVDEPENHAILKSREGTGKYSTTDDGFLIDADFTFLGTTKIVTVKMFFVRYDANGLSATGTNAGLNSVFEITAADFLINSSIGKIINIEINSTMGQNP